jgi:hypothetical protein
MYCQFCGYQLAGGMNYCKQCGAEVRPSSALSQTSVIHNTTGIAWAIAVLGVGGLAVIFGTAIPLFTVVPVYGVAVFAMLLGFLILSIGLGALIRHMQKIASLAIDNKERALPHAAPGQGRYLEAGSAGMTSVTENTTRSFDCPVTGASPD